MKEAKRHGFITFWLWFCLVLNILGALIFARLLFFAGGLISFAQEPMWWKVAQLLCTVVLIVGFIMLLDWRKSGFFVVVTAQVAGIILIVISAPSLPGYTTYGSIPSTIVGLGLLYLILQLRHDGITYWDAMGKVVRQDYKE